MSPELKAAADEASGKPTTDAAAKPPRTDGLVHDSEMALYVDGDVPALRREIERLASERDDARARLAIAVEALRECVRLATFRTPSPRRGIDYVDQAVEKTARTALAKIDPSPRCPHHNDDRTDCAQCWEGE